MQGTTPRLLCLLAALPLLLATFAFYLQWWSGVDDPSKVAKLYGEEEAFPGVGRLSHRKNLISCDKVAAENKRYGGPSFPHGVPVSINGYTMAGPKLAICTSTSAGLDQVLPWVYYHKALGVHTYFLFVEGKAANSSSVRVLENVPGVKVIQRTKELEEQQSKSRIWGESWLAGFFYQPCNYELFVKQSLNMEMAIVMAQEAGMEWLLHVDTDELLNPKGPMDYSMQRLLGEQPADVDLVIFPNYETIIDRDDIIDPFAEVFIFKKNFDHMPKERYYANYREATRNNPNYFLTYGNGKSAARVIPDLRPNGAHRWHNYAKIPNEITHAEASVLHYTYARYSDLTTRKNRCGCKPTKEDVKKCFMLDFDRLAFIVASTATEEEMRAWYKEHVVWSHSEINSLMEKGLFDKIYAPQVIIRSIYASGILEQSCAAVGVSSEGLWPELRRTKSDDAVASDWAKKMLPEAGQEAAGLEGVEGGGSAGREGLNASKVASVDEVAASQLVDNNVGVEKNAGALAKLHERVAELKTQKEGGGNLKRTK